jgi:hypothetical protein
LFFCEGLGVEAGSSSGAGAVLPLTRGPETDVLALANSAFPAHLLGFRQIQYAISQVCAGSLPGNILRLRGLLYELEAALCLKSLGEEIIGFEADITFVGSSISVFVNSCAYDLRSTEYDVITTHWAVECKRNPDDFMFDKVCDQLIKEQIMIRWLRDLVVDINTGRLSIVYSKLTSRKDGVRFPVFILNGPSTGFRDVYISSTWISFGVANLKGIGACADLIMLLASKNPIVCCKGAISVDNKSYLDSLGIVTRDNFNLEGVVGMPSAPSFKSFVFDKNEICKQLRMRYFLKSLFEESFFMCV